jgi:arylsulfatase A-like enzyme
VTQPNIILIFTDNQMAETLGCYGNAEIHTPNLDHMAARGLRFENAYCANAFCSPCRATLLTGKMPSQHGVHSWIDDRRSADWPKGWHALAGQQTLPEELQKIGYATGLFGKYHLGEPSVPAPGWDSWVTMADGHVRSFYDNRIFDNGDIYAQPGHSVDFFTDKALSWIAAQTGPYFAYIPLPAPYGHWPATNDGNRNRHAPLYDDCPMQTVPRQGISAEAVRNFMMVQGGSGHGLDFSMLMCAPNHLPTLRNYYSQITMIDEAVGRILDAAPDALVIFTTDHGLSLGHHGFWGHGASTYPSNLHRAAHSIPMIFHGPGISPRVEPRHVTNTDLFATVLAAAGGAPDPTLPSRALLSSATDWGEDAAYAEQEETRVIRTPNWLFMKRFRGPDTPDLPDALYDLHSDPGETRNLADQPDHKDTVAALSDKIDTYFARYTQPAADLWAGGRPIQNSMLPDYWRGVWGEDWAPVFHY